MASKTIHFDAKFIDELTAKAQKLTARECELMANVEIRKSFADCDKATIEKLEDIYWIVSVAKRAAAAAGCAS